MGNGGFRDEKGLLSNVSNRVRISVEGGKERQHKIHKTIQNNTTTDNGTRTHIHTHTNDKHTRNRTRYNVMQIYMKIFITSK